MLSAGHCVYTDVSKTNYLDNGIFDPWFPDKIEFYFGADGSKVYRGNRYLYSSRRHQHLALRQLWQARHEIRKAR